jgi:hypothetical protein
MLKQHPYLASLVLGLGLLWIKPAMAIEEPKYEVMTTDAQFEVRHYAPILIAETIVEGDMDAASSKGFRLIADFIFGNNLSPDTDKKSKIAMTAPVTVEPQAAEPSMKTTKTWRINFVMPSQYTLATIPKPKNNAVTLREVPSKYFIVHKYSGFNTVSRVQAKTDEAVEWATKRSFKIIGTPQLSRYDPPWTLPMFRRNEIMIEIAAPN